MRKVSHILEPSHSVVPTKRTSDSGEIDEVTIATARGAPILDPVSVKDCHLLKTTLELADYF